MKITILSLLLITSVQLSISQSGEPNGRTYSIRPLTLKKGVNAIEFEKFAFQKLNSAFRNVPGINARVAKADRGANKGEYLFVVICDSKATRNHYYPNENATEYSKAAQEMNSKIESALLGLFKFADQEVTSAVYTDYIFIE